MDWLQGGQRIHFVGIGGSGMCTLAELLHARGDALTGSDCAVSDNVIHLQELGIPVSIGHAAANVGDAQAVIYTAAVSDDNPELVEARRRGLPVIERAEALGALSAEYAHTVAVAGTHGKTTTSSMIAHILLKAGLDPSVAIGGRLPLLGANGHAGKGGAFICEACEFKDHYLQLHYDTGIVLDVDADHLDYFGSLDGVIRSFHQFAARAHTLIANGDDANTRRAMEGLRPVYYGTDQSYPWQARNIQMMDAYGDFDIWHDDAFFAHVRLGVPGEHNVHNALAAAAVAHRCGASAAQIADGLADFHGAGRRFEFLGSAAGVAVADDYAHHPTEIEATLRTAKALPYRAVWAVFQPFTYTRTARHLDAFAAALSLADRAIVCDILGSRESNTVNVSAKDITDRMAQADGMYVATFEEVAEYIAEHVPADTLVLTMGGGDVYKCARLILEKLKEKNE
ncbi:MAG: UDP-N-acetylmuramate--L-alanine ligase [Oscillospiraceae bacterium]|nr:UDP-N-acetylmuramate--L-alanine ligase [Oscillospiraceae bacterium]